MRLSLCVPLTVVALVVGAAHTPIAAQAGRAAFEAGRRHMAANEPDKAEDQFERAIKLEPNVAEYHAGLADAIGERIRDANPVRQGLMARRLRHALERAVELDSMHLGARQGLVDFYLEAPAMMGGGVDKARAQVAAMKQINPARGLQAEAQVAWHGRDTVATERAYRAVVALQPDSAAPVIALAQRLQTWNRQAEAFAVFDAFLQRQPQSVPVRYQVGRLAAITGEQLPRGERLLRALIADTTWQAGGLVPPRAAAHARLGDVLRKQGKPAEARAAYNTALALDPNQQIAKDGLAALR